MQHKGMNKGGRPKGSKNKRQPARTLPDGDQVLTRGGVAAIMGVSVGKVDKDLANGTGPPHIKLPGGGIRFWLSDLLAWLERYRKGEPISVEDRARLLRHEVAGPILRHDVPSNTPVSEARGPP